jgi:hypothetical protein
MATGAVHVVLKPQIATAPRDQREIRASGSSKIHQCLVRSYFWTGAKVRINEFEE